MPTAIPALVATIKDQLAKAAKSVKQSEQHFIAAGMRLKELKARKGNVPWYEYVQKTFKLSRSRADELIRMADGKVTLDQTRAAKAASVAKSKANNSNGLDGKAAATSGGSPTPSPGFGQFRNANGETKSSCDYNGEDPADIAEPGDSDEVIRQRKFAHHATEALRHAREHGFDEAADSEITSEIIRMAKRAGEAWSKVAAELQRRATGGTGHEEAHRQALH